MVPDRRGSTPARARRRLPRSVFLTPVAGSEQGAGVRNVFDVLRGGIGSTLLAPGRGSVRDLVPGDIIVPDGFAVALRE